MGSRRVADLLNQATAQLAAVAENPRLDAELLLLYVLDWPRTALYTRQNQSVSTSQDKQYLSLIEQRARGYPVAYMLGQKEFWSLQLQVNNNVLIPRADTELLVETALAISPEHTLDVLELGTGSGAIALALATERPAWNITALDISDTALAVAQENARRLKKNQITFLQSNWFTQVRDQRFNLIVSNPPYICANDSHLQRDGIRFEPRIALLAGADGLNAIREIVAEATHYLATGGMLLLEHGYDQRSSVCKMMQEQGYTRTTCLRDSAGNDRVTYGTWERHEQH